jgi:redox-sensitive bicupin YhaK (pirin superfamily)
MTAGRGVVHSEHPLDTVQHGIQLWTSLPRARKAMAPRYQRIDSATIPKAPRDGATVRVIAGELDGVRGPAQTLMPLFLWHATLPPGARLAAPVHPGSEAAAYVIEGEGRFGEGDAVVAKQGQLILWEDGDGALHASNAGSKNLELMLLGGAPAEGPLVFHGPFVMNSVEQVRAAEIAFRTGQMGQL